jgi:hypothetical protein
MDKVNTLDNETYLFHQTPVDLAKDLIEHIPLVEGDVVFEPFKGEGAFYDQFPEYVNKEWCEIEEGRDYTEHTDRVDWVITNPPFRLETDKGRVNGFYPLLDYFAGRVDKGLAFLVNDRCVSALTPRRIKLLSEKGLYLHKMVVCGVKKWRGRYYFLVFKKEPSSVLIALNKTY